MKEILPFLLCIAAVYCAVSVEIAPVTDQRRAQGYACNSRTFGLMREGDTRNNYRPNFCGQASCHNGVVDYYTCGVILRRDCEIQHDYSKPYPRCCSEYFCA